ncbi:uncharacterized protein JN550_003977 [Neoarthrinium moseri]|uniref:uncharacterized protein n=1 Tax=Neoarthrinium moseri TaxID=1658444 RepID=UPI001FDB33DB|nr:uncharacterized protein JN550_003977 [Neoarthrinium moseri]KAI1872258.1 hypothetical protein JN550_003977 [Neoarthrinium moseri]
MSLATKRSTRSMNSQWQMPVIEEDDNDTPGAPPLPEKSPRRSQLVAEQFMQPFPREPPPAYSINTPPATASTSSPQGKEGLHDKPVKDKKPAWLAKRGGWWRVAAVAIVIIACILALALGLALGLRNRSTPTTTESSESFPVVFPAGSYAFNTALANISTACTSNANTFRCYPYTTYSASKTASSATFYWTITQVGEAAYMISAARNPFVPQFTNISVDLLDRGLATERMTFSFPLDLAIVPAVALDASNTAATCYFNGTTMGATIWTKKAAEYPSSANGSSATAQTSTSFGNWPYAVEVSQVANSGDGVPDCRDSKGQPLGDFDLSGAAQGNCSCMYSNFGLDS